MSNDKKLVYRNGKCEWVSEAEWVQTVKNNRMKHDAAEQVAASKKKKKKRGWF